MQGYKQFLNEERKHKYNSIAKIMKVLGKNPSEDKIIAFIKKEYNLDNPDHQDIVGDIMGNWHIDHEQYFDEEGQFLTEGKVSSNFKVGDKVTAEVTKGQEVKVTK
tara:strand:- start:2023 stop:2340 length:318 start_codon:yes stop_codon:yes gene_type:complete